MCQAVNETAILEQLCPEHPMSVPTKDDQVHQEKEKEKEKEKEREKGRKNKERGSKGIKVKKCAVYI